MNKHKNKTSNRRDQRENKRRKGKRPRLIVNHCTLRVQSVPPEAFAIVRIIRSKRFVGEVLRGFPAVSMLELF